LLVSWVGRHDLKTLAGLEEQGRPCQLAGLELASAYYMNELLLQLLPPDAPCPTVFASYAGTLDLLSNLSAQPQQQPDANNEAIEIGLRLFELELLDTLGLVPDFANCRRASGANLSAALAVEADKRYRYYPEAGYAIDILDAAAADAGQVRDAENTPADFHDAPNALPSVEVGGETLLALGSRQLQNKQVLREAKQVMRRQLGQHLGGKPLKSREMIAFYTASRKGPADE